jgi:4-alpha-glucanotransferase
VGRNPSTGRIAGIVMHPTSLDGPYGTGDLGAACFEFVDWLVTTGMQAWQARYVLHPLALLALARARIWQ